MFVRDEPYVDARVRRLLEGPLGILFRLAFAVLFAGVFAAVIAGTAGPAAIPQLPFVSSLACPAGHRVTQASAQEIFPQGSGLGRGRSQRMWLGCRDEAGHVMASEHPHLAIMRTAWMLTALALLPAMIAGVGFLFRPPPARRR